MVHVDRMHQLAAKYPRIYVAALSQKLTESDVREVFSAFGDILTCEWPRNTLVWTVHVRLCM